MANILMLSLVYGPDTVSTAVLMTELMQGLQKRGHAVTVLTSMPHYNPSPQVLANPSYRASLLKLYTETQENGIRVFRVYMPLKRQRVWLRALDYLWFHFATTLVALMKIRAQDVIFVPSPPITLGLSGYLFARLFKAKLMYDVLELWPDAPVRMGLIKNRLLLRLVYGVERLVYRGSAIIACIAQSFINTLVQRGIPPEKLRLAPLFVDVEWMHPRSKDNTFSIANGFQDKFVALYAGNIGLTQGLEILVEVASYLGHASDIVIVIIGDGAGRAKLEQALRRSAPPNLFLLPFQPRESVPDIYATADVALSPMLPGFSHDTLPSKIYTIFASGRPVIAACEQDTETAWVVDQSGGGLTVAPNSASEMAEAILRLYNNPAQVQAMGQQARQWVVQHYSKDAVIEAHDAIISQMA